MIPLRRLAPLLSICLFLIGCAGGADDGSSISSSAASSAQATSVLPAELAPLSASVLTALKTKDAQALAQLAHPESGVRITPFTYVSEDDVVLASADLGGIFQSTKTYHWGVEDGSGQPIDGTFAAYYDKYLWDHDFTATPEVTLNRTMDRGSSTDNARDFYGPDAQVVEYHFPGFDPQYAGMDWSSLRLVFQKANDGKWYVTGLIHDRWGP